MRFDRGFTELVEVWIEIARIELSPGVRPFRAQQIRDLFLNIRELSKNLGARVLLCDWLTESQTEVMRLRAAQAEGEPLPVSPPREGADPPRLKAMLEMVVVAHSRTRTRCEQKRKNRKERQIQRETNVVSRLL